MIGMLTYALQEQAKKSGYMFCSADDGKYHVVDTLNEKLVSVEPNIEEVADLLGCICSETEEERRFGRVVAQGLIDPQHAADLIYEQIIERRKREAEQEAQEAKARFREGVFRERKNTELADE